MRARYAAYATGNLSFVMESTHPDSPHRKADRSAWQTELTAFVTKTDFEGLEVVEAHSDGDRGEVAFRAQLRQGGRDASFGERSTFFRVGGEWLYYAGTRF